MTHSGKVQKEDSAELCVMPQLFHSCLRVWLGFWAQQGGDTVTSPRTEPPDRVPVPSVAQTTDVIKQLFSPRPEIHCLQLRHCQSQALQNAHQALRK